MEQHKDQMRLKHMLESCKEAENLASNKNREDIFKERILELALTRLVEIIGEAATKISENTKMKYSKIQWKEIIGLRNRLFHGYDSVDLDILWDIIEFDLPVLVKELQKIIPDNQA
ncbi:DUF86 domain-containing protein [Sedimentisphaera salicampi]|uniref:DUF86 domain-containing protein n=1 Tax=Sedimentisphaera salicampi TaxID=1941349 RepID=A0A1W6LME7_9BACT|nr:HepT-like ribonuclease domain-containing protein [Sedimentisphaera salicampi]ARN56947.1 hypothetical protein STSP1_01340 [Sedimentisphaera salicampi]